MAATSSNSGPPTDSSLKTSNSPQTSELRSPFLIQFSSPDGDLYWQAALTATEAKLMWIEIALYNKWLNKLEMGTAPAASYEDPDWGRDLFLVKHPDYQAIFGRPGARALYEPFIGSFDMIDLSEPPADSEDSDIIGEYHQGNLIMKPGEDLIEMITRPYDAYGSFSMGFHVLPMTQRLIDEKRL